MSFAITEIEIKKPILNQFAVDFIQFLYQNFIKIFSEINHFTYYLKDYTHA